MTNASLIAGAQSLAEKIPQFQRIITDFGYPPLWNRPPGFSTLIQIILEQQVSLASAKKTFDRLNSVLIVFTPESFLKLSDAQLKQCGFSRQKTKYCRIIASSILNETLNPDKLTYLKDEQVKEKLMSFTGIGHWTSDIYLLMVLLRPDVWPHGDRALAVAAYKVFDLHEIPDYKFLSAMAEKWIPYRSIAARFLWHYYLST